ncbi:hypothetical protein GC176_14400 [bacterium]|nr:hypothetical protein [bacterium]
MLVLSRKRCQSIRIGEHIEIKVLAIEGGRVRLGIDAPADVPVLRGELIRSGDAECRDEPPECGATSVHDCPQDPSDALGDDCPAESEGESTRARSAARADSWSQPLRSVCCD